MSSIDISHFERVALGDRQFASEIISRFLSDAAIYRLALRKNMENKDFLAIKRVLQQLKSSGQVFGAVDFVENVRRIEMADLDKYDQLKPKIEEAYGQLLQMIEEVKDIQKV